MCIVKSALTWLSVVICECLHTRSVLDCNNSLLHLESMLVPKVLARPWWLLRSAWGKVASKTTLHFPLYNIKVAVYTCLAIPSENILIITLKPVKWFTKDYIYMCVLTCKRFILVSSCVRHCWTLLLNWLSSANRFWSTHDTNKYTYISKHSSQKVNIRLYMAQTCVTSVSVRTAWGSWAFCVLSGLRVTLVCNSSSRAQRFCNALWTAHTLASHSHWTCSRERRELILTHTQNMSVRNY